MKRKVLFPVLALVLALGLALPMAAATPVTANSSPDVILYTTDTVYDGGGGTATVDICALNVTTGGYTVVASLHGISIIIGGSPNGNAWDPVNNRLYFTDPQPKTLYFWDGVPGPGTANVAGITNGIIAGATFYNGAYYYIANGTDDLRKVTFDASGNIASDTLLKANFDGGVGASYWFGDIAILDDGTNVTLYGSAKVQPNSREHFFSIDLVGSSYSYTLIDNQFCDEYWTTGGKVGHPQVAFGCDGKLYTAIGGYYHTVDLANGALTSTGVAPPAVRIPDLASGPQVLDHFLGYKVKTTKVCDGGVSLLKLHYNGLSDADVVVTGKRGVVLFTGMVVPDSDFEIGTGEEKLGTSITITTTIGGVVSETTIHTSCSQPIGTGQTFGDFTVVAGQSLKGGPLETPAPKFEPVVVELTDQFATGLFKVEKPDKLYNPVDKNHEGINDPNTHLMSYKVKLVEYLEPPTCVPCKGGLTSLTLRYNGSSGALVVVTGGSEPFEKTLNESEEFMIVGGGKDGKLDKDVTITVDGELKAKIHTSCSQPIGTGQTFGDFTVVAGESKDGRSLCPIIEVESQFGTIFVTIDKPDRLLVPTAKSLTGPIEPLYQTGVDHFLGYKIKAPKDTPELLVTLVDQFGPLKLYDVKKPTMLFVPVDKNGEEIKNPEAYLISYKIKPAKDQPKHKKVLGIYTNNQFGPLKLNTDKEEELLVPCTKILP